MTKKELIKKNVPVTFVATAVMLLAAPMLAQPRFEYRPGLLSFQQQMLRVSWQLKRPGYTQEIAQSYAPAVLDFTFGRNSHLLISSAAGWSNAALASNYEMSGVTDTRLRFSQRLADRWMLGVGLNLPTGDNRLDFNQNVVANLLTESILSFPLQRLGVGTDLEFSLAHALNLSGTLGLGLGGTLIVPGKFEFRRDQNAAYKPGARYVLTAMFNYIGTPIKWQLNLMGQIYGRDQIEGKNFFKQGMQFEPSFAGEWRFARQWEGGVSLRHIWKDDNEIAMGTGNAIPPEHFYINNTTFAVLHLNRYWGRRAQTGVLLGWNRFAESNQQLNRATISRLGLNMAVKISGHLILHAGGDYAAGQAENGAIDLHGYSTAFTLSTRF